MPTMNIMNKSEQAMFEDPQIFNLNSVERKRFFSFLTKVSGIRQQVSDAT